MNVIGGKDVFHSVLITSKWSGYSQRQSRDLTKKVAHEWRWLLSRINLFCRSLFVMVIFHDTQIELYFTSNYFVIISNLYKNSLPEELLPKFHSRQCNIAVNSEDGITVYVLYYCAHVIVGSLTFLLISGRVFTYKPSYNVIMETPLLLTRGSQYKHYFS